jgi:hypothetical protein
MRSTGSASHHAQRPGGAQVRLCGVRQPGPGRPGRPGRRPGLGRLALVRRAVRQVDQLEDVALGLHGPPGVPARRPPLAPVTVQRRLLVRHKVRGAPLHAYQPARAGARARRAQPRCTAPMRPLDGTRGSQSRRPVAACAACGRPPHRRRPEMSVARLCQPACAAQAPQLREGRHQSATGLVQAAGASPTRAPPWRRGRPGTHRAGRQAVHLRACAGALSCSRRRRACPPAARGRARPLAAAGRLAGRAPGQCRLEHGPQGTGWVRAEAHAGHATKQDRVGLGWDPMGPGRGRAPVRVEVHAQHVGGVRAHEAQELPRACPPARIR